MKVTSLGQTDQVSIHGAGHGRNPNTKKAASDQVQLTNLSSSLSAAQSNSPQRLARLEHLAAAVSRGDYQVDASQVSHSIIEDSLRGARA